MNPSIGRAAQLMINEIDGMYEDGVEEWDVRVTPGHVRGHAEDVGFTLTKAEAKVAAAIANDHIDTLKRADLRFAPRR